MMINSKSDFLKLSTENGVPKIVWCFWAGGEMNETRKLSFNILLKNIGVPVCLITNDNFKDFVLPEAPVHAAYPYLSAVHQSDYLRTYFLNYYGGAWHDIKATKVGFSKVWENFQDPDIYLIGKPETRRGPAKVYDSDGNWMPNHWEDLVSACFWVGKPNTPLSRELFEKTTTYLDFNLASLQKYPAKHPREKKIEIKFVLHRYLKMLWYQIQGRNIKYPLPWALFGNVFHPLNFKYRKNILQTLPTDTLKNAGIRHR